jgi:hypothetical protein
MAQPNSSPAETTSAADQGSISDLVQRLTEQTSRLAQKEVELAKAELAVKGKRIGTGAGAFSAAGLLATLALGALTAAAILGLASAVDGWLAALIVAAAYLLIAGVLALFGRSKVQAATPPLPEQALESVKEDARQTKQRAKEGRA